METRIRPQSLFPVLLAGLLFYAAPVSSQGSGAIVGELALDLGGAVQAPLIDRLSVGSDGELFVLDRSGAVLIRVSPETGRALWQIDGSESGEPFLDPAYLSRPDGFYIYLTDRGRRRIWRIDYRGEVRGRLELSFATDPVLLDLAAGGQMVVFDRAAGLVYLLDDSGRPLWSFTPGGGQITAEPLDITVSQNGATLYLLWPGGNRITALDLFGAEASALEFEAPGFSPRRLAAVLDSGGREWLCLSGSQDRIIRVDQESGKTSPVADNLGQVWDIQACTGERGVLYALVGMPAKVVMIHLEKSN